MSEGTITVEKMLFSLGYNPKKVVEYHGAPPRERPGYFQFRVHRCPWGGWIAPQVMATPEQFGARRLSTGSKKDLINFLLGHPPYDLRLVVADATPADFFTRSEIENNIRKRFISSGRLGRRIGGSTRRSRTRREQPKPGNTGIYRRPTRVDASKPRLPNRFEIYTSINPVAKGRQRAKMADSMPLGVKFGTTFFTDVGGEKQIDPSVEIPLQVVYRIQYHTNKISGLVTNPRITARVGKAVVSSIPEGGVRKNKSGEEMWIALGGAYTDTHKDRRVSFKLDRGLHVMAASNRYSLRALPLKVYASSEEQARRRMRRKIIQMKNHGNMLRGLKLENLWLASGEKVVPRRIWDKASRAFRYRGGD